MLLLQMKPQKQERLVIGDWRLVICYFPLDQLEGGGDRVGEEDTMSQVSPYAPQRFVSLAAANYK